MASEVLSPEDRPGDVRQKVEEYLASGVPLVVVVDPDERSVTVYRRLEAAVTCREDGDVVDLADVVDDFRCTVADVFA